MGAMIARRGAIVDCGLARRSGVRWRTIAASAVIIAGLLLAAAVPSKAHAATEAEIVLLVGKGERRDSEKVAWGAAALNQKVKPGGEVRTLANSQMGVLLPDRTQMRLNQNSHMQIKSAVESAEWAQTNVRLNSGRAWSQARPLTAPAAGTAPSPRVSIETPSATMSIRGTDWEVEVRPDGSTQLVVLSGIVHMDNPHGAIVVGRGEAALAEPGKAPVKFVLVNPKSRVQWVSSWRPTPRRWAGSEAQAHARAIELIESGNLDAATALLTPKAAADSVAAALTADVRMSQGDIDGAIALLTPHAKGAKGRPAAQALLARAMVRADRLDEGRRLLESALAASPNAVELLLAAGELALLDADVEAARRAYGKVLELEPSHPEAWYGIGLIESEREEVALARNALDRSLASAPGFPAARSERAAVESFAGELAQARRMLEELLAREPDNYIALTVFGINLLKEGRAEAALEAFLKAGTIEPRYARAWLYSGVAFYQLDDRARALEAFRKAAELDAKDPLPHLLESVALGDALEYGAAISAAQRAQERMPFLKSLNQIANDQRGSANLGSALANFGLEEWAARYAYDGYSMFWGGSHLFLADRYTGQFTKNSELFKGYLTDPTVFGASNRNSTLITAPGHYAKVDVFLERTDWKQGALIGTLNGLSVESVPVAYFVSGDLSTTRSREDASSGDGGNFTLGLGARPTHEVGIFGFATGTNTKADIRTDDLPNDRLDSRDVRADIGANLKFGARSQLWFKLGYGKTTSDVSGALVANIGVGQLDRFHEVARQEDVQLSHSFGTDDYTITLGIEHSRLDRPGELIATFAPPVGRLRFSQTQELRSTDLYVSGKWALPQGFRVQADLWGQSAKVDHSELITRQDLAVPAPPVVLQSATRAQRDEELNPRLGVTWNIQPGQSLRAVGQRWRRPASVSTLGPIDTEGVPVNDRLPMAGGLYERGRIQFDSESSGRFYLQAFLDSERIDNGVRGAQSVLPDLELTQLEALRNRRQVFTPVADIEETPRFQEGRVDTFGAAGNFLVSRQHSIAVRYLRRNNWQTGANQGLRIPYIPRDMLRASSQWVLPDRWLLGVSATYRSLRYRDDQNSMPIDSGWAFGMTAYWESADKRSSLQAILDNLLSDKAAGVDNRSHLTVRYTYRF